MDAHQDASAWKPIAGVVYLLLSGRPMEGYFAKTLQL
jgi:hypothetical protein